MMGVRQGLACKKCGQTVEPAHRYCPWCAAPQQRKSVALFAAHPDVDAPGRGLRVSQYFDPADGPPHTRLSIYDDDGEVTAVVALDDAETSRLARFVAGLPVRGGTAGARGVARRMFGRR